MQEINPFGLEERKDKYNEQAVYSIALLYNVINARISSFLSRYRLTPGKFNILMVIKHKGGQKGIKQVDVSKSLIVTPSNMTKLIDKLEKDKLVARFALEGDRRVNMIKITDKGSKLLDSLWENYCLQMEGIVVGITKIEQKQTAALLSLWLKVLQGGQ